MKILNSSLGSIATVDQTADKMSLMAFKIVNKILIISDKTLKTAINTLYNNRPTILKIFFGIDVIYDRGSLLLVRTLLFEILPT